MSGSSPSGNPNPSGPNPSGRKAILGLAIAGIVFLVVLIGVSVWVVKHFVGQGQETIIIPVAGPRQQPITVNPNPTPAAPRPPANNPPRPNPANANAPRLAPPLPPGMAVTLGGIVNDESGNPVGNVSVNINYVTQIPPPTFRGTPRPGMNYGGNVSIRTDAQGKWIAENIPKDGIKDPNGNFRIRLVARDFADTPIAKPPLDTLQTQTAILVIAKGVDLTGTVTDAGGQPVDGVRIFTRSLNQSPNAANTPDATTDADGKFTIHRIAPGQSIPLTAMKNGLAPAFQSVPIPANGATVALTLQKGRDITGRVVDRTGGPVAGAAVMLYMWHNQYRPFNLNATTGADGNYTLHNAPVDEFEIQINKPGYTGGGLTRVPAGGSPPDVMLSRQITLRGLVVDAGTNEPIKQFSVVTGAKWTNGSDINFQPGTARDFTNGSYSLPLTGYAGNVESWYIRIEARGYLPVVSPPLTDSGTQNFSLKPGNDLTGHILDLNGQPVPNVIVSLATESERLNITDGTLRNSIARQITTTADGSYDFPPQVGKYTIVALTPQGYTMADQDAVAKSPDIHLSSYGRIEGKVISDKPAGLELRLQSDRNMDGQVVYLDASATTIEDGSFAFDHVPAGDYQVYRVQRANAPDGSSMQMYVQGVPVTVAVGKASTISLGFKGRTVTGHALDKSGTPIAGVEIRGFSQLDGSNVNLTAQTDAAGAFEIHDVPPQDVSLTASKDGFLITISTLPTTQNTVEFSLSPQPVIHGSVTDATTHEPIPSFHIRVGAIAGPNSSPRFQNSNPNQTPPTFTNGQYQQSLSANFAAAPTGWVLRVEAKGYLPALSPVLHDSGTQDFTLQPGVDLKGSVVDAAGNPAKGITLVEVNSGQQLNVGNASVNYTDGTTVQADSNGQFDFPPQIGKFEVVALSPAGYAMADQNALATSTQLRLTAWGRIEGTAKIGSKVAANVQISVQGDYTANMAEDGPRFFFNSTTQTDAGGHFAAENIPAGPALINRLARMRRGPSYVFSNANTRNVVVISGQTTPANIGGDGRPVTGRFVLPTGTGDLKSQLLYANIMISPPMPPEMPDNIKSGSSDDRKQWLTTFVTTPAGADYEEKLRVAGVMSSQHAVEFNDDGTFRIEDIAPGDYLMTIIQRPLQSAVAAPTTAPSRPNETTFTMPAITDDLKDKPLVIPDIVLKAN